MTRQEIVTARTPVTSKNPVTAKTPLHFDGVVLDLRSAGCVYAEDEARLLMEKFDGSLLEQAVARRIEGIPLEHLLGWADFGGLRIAVEPGVFVPRRRTRLLALAHAVADLTLHAVDIEPAAVRCARRNVAPVGGHVYQGDLYEPLPDALRGGVDVLVANAPYVPTSALGSMPSEARDHEPRSALDGGADGLDVQRRIVTGAGQWLAPGGHLLIETSVAQAEGTARIVEAAGFRAAVVHCDELDGTVVVGNLSAPGEHRSEGEHR